MSGSSQRGFFQSASHETVSQTAGMCMSCSLKRVRTLRTANEGTNEANAFQRCYLICGSEKPSMLKYVEFTAVAWLQCECPPGLRLMVCMLKSLTEKRAEMCHGRPRFCWKFNGS